MVVSYTKVYEDSTSFPGLAAASYDVANPLPAGLIEAVGIRFTGTAASNLAQGDQSQLISAFRMTLNGDQWANFNPLAGSNTDALRVGRMGALVQDIGGFVATAPSLTSQDTTIWVPCGISVPQNSRFELHVGYIASAVAMLSAGRFQVWIKYGKSLNATVLGNMTSQAIASDTQTMVSVKIPTYKNALVSGVIAQCPVALDELSELIVKPLGDFAMSATQIRGASGASQNGYQYMAPELDLTENMWCNNVSGYYFIPLYDLKSTDGNVILLLTADALDDVTRQWTFTPVLSLPTGGSGERQAVQTAREATGSGATILTRAENQ
tara:strand:+ start:307 stop:1278 length:972 start_codon:yes stop_codon:yes gene_type:complete